MLSSYASISAAPISLPPAFPTANSYVSSLSEAGAQSVVITVAGNLVGTLRVYIVDDGAALFPTTSQSVIYLNGIYSGPTGSTIVFSTAGSANGIYVTQFGPGSVYVICTAYTSGTATVTLATGPAMEAFDVTTFGALGDGSTDDQPAIQNAIYAGTYLRTIIPGSTGINSALNLYFPPGTYIIGSPLTFQPLPDYTINVVFKGYPSSPTKGIKVTPRSILSYPAATGSMIQCNPALGFALIDLGLTFTYLGPLGATYTGNLVDLSGRFTGGKILDSTGILVQNCTFFPTPATLDGCNSYLYLDGSETVLISACAFNGADYAIQGFSTAMGMRQYSNGASINNETRFAQQRIAPVLNPGQAWSFNGCEVEPNAINESAFITLEPGAECDALSIIGCWLGDGGTISGGTWIQWFGKGLLLAGNHIECWDSKALEILSGGGTGITVLSNQFYGGGTTTMNTAVDFGSTTGNSQFVFLGNAFFGTITPIAYSSSLPTGSTYSTTGTLNTDGLTSSGTVSAGALSSSGTLSVTGSTTCNGVTASGTVSAAALSSSGTLNVTGSTTCNGVTASGTVSAAALSSSGTLNVTGGTTCNGVTASGTVSAGALTSSGTLSVTGSTTCNGVTASGTVSAGALSSSGTLNVTGGTTCNGIAASGAVTGPSMALNGATLPSGQVLGLYNGNTGMTQLSNPGAPTSLTAVSVGTGNLANGPYNYKVTFVTPSGETALGTVGSITIAGGPSNVDVIVPTGWTCNVYRTKVGPGTDYYLLGSVASGGTYHDMTDDSMLTGGSYTLKDNTTAGRFFLNSTIAGGVTGFSTWLGLSALSSLAGGSVNTAMGHFAGRNITTGSFNSMFGADSGIGITTGGSNSLFGYQAGDSVTTGSFNMLIGGNAGHSITTGSSNLCIGYKAGFVGLVTGTGNVFLGTNSGSTGADFSDSVAIGYNSVVSDLACTAIGYGSTIYGNHSTAIGDGASIGTVGTPVNFAVAIGYNSSVTANNTMALGGTGATDHAKVVINGTTAGGQFQVNPVSAGTIGVIVKGATSATADLQQWQDSSGTLLAKVDAGGKFTCAALSTPGSITLGTVAATTTYPILSTDYLVKCNATGGAFNATLPTAVGCAGRQYVIFKSDSSANAVTINTTSSQTLLTLGGTVTTYPLALQGNSITVISDGANWLITSVI